MSTRRVDVMCVVCRDGLDSGSQTCLACGALYHEECLAGLRGRCATLGCRGLRPAQATPSSGRPGRLVLSAAQVAAGSQRRLAAGPRARDHEPLMTGGCWVALAGAAVFAVALVGVDRFELAVWLTWVVVGVGSQSLRVLRKAQQDRALPRATLAPPAPTTPIAAPLAPAAPPPPPAWTGTCVLCPSPTLVNRPVCRDHAALLDDPLGPTVRVRPRPGQLYGPGLVDEGLSRRPG